MVEEIDPATLQAELASENPPVLLDVREAQELEISRLPNVLHIPMNLIPARASELNPSDPIVVVCRSGNRSRQVAQYLMGRGFKNVRNLSTGMNGWAREVDPTIQTY